MNIPSDNQSAAAIGQTLANHLAAPLPLAGVRVLCFESRMQDEIRGLLHRQGAAPTVCPSLREVPLSDNAAALDFGERLRRSEIDVLIILTGVGLRALGDVLQTQMPSAEFHDALRRTLLVVRGPKPAAVLREWKVAFSVAVPEPNTWRELLAALDAATSVRGKTVAVQEYGQPSPELSAALLDRGAKLLPVPVYRWALPVDCQPLEQAVRDVIAGECDVLMFTSASQLHNVLEIAGRLGLAAEFLAAANQRLIASVGPTASENLRAAGLDPDVEPEHPKMGHLVNALASWVKTSGLAKRQRVVEH